MKYFGKRFLSGIFALIMIFSLLCTTASAAVQSSAYLDGYYASLTADPHGAMVVSVQVTGVGYMPEIGVKTIYVYESSNGTDFHWVATYDSSGYPKMMGSGTFFYEDVITHYGTPGLYYYAKAFIYAGNSTGGDERVYNTSIKQARY